MGGRVLALPGVAWTCRYFKCRHFRFSGAAVCSRNDSYEVFWGPRNRRQCETALVSGDFSRTSGWPEPAPRSRQTCGLVTAPSHRGHRATGRGQLGKGALPCFSWQPRLSTRTSFTPTPQSKDLLSPSPFAPCSGLTGVPLEMLKL